MWIKILIVSNLAVEEVQNSKMSLSFLCILDNCACFSLQRLLLKKNRTSNKPKQIPTELIQVSQWSFANNDRPVALMKRRCISCFPYVAYCQHVKTPHPRTSEVLRPHAALTYAMSARWSCHLLSGLTNSQKGSKVINHLNDCCSVFAARERCLYVFLSLC